MHGGGMVWKLTNRKVVHCSNGLLGCSWCCCLLNAIVWLNLIVQAFEMAVLELTDILQSIQSECPGGGNHFFASTKFQHTHRVPRIYGFFPFMNVADMAEPPYVSRFSVASDWHLRRGVVFLFWSVRRKNLPLYPGNRVRSCRLLNGASSELFLWGFCSVWRCRKVFYSVIIVRNLSYQEIRGLCLFHV